MAIGPVQLIVLGFQHPEFHGEIIAELERLKENDTVRVIDALAVYKDAGGEVEVEHLSNLTQDEAIEVGSTVAALIGLGIEGEEGMVEGAIAGAAAAQDGVEVFSDEDGLGRYRGHPERLGRRAAAARAPVGHPACATRSGARAGSASATASSARSTSIEIGLLTAEEAQLHHAMETATAATTS